MTIKPGTTLKSGRTGAIFTVTKVLPEHVAVKSGKYRGCFPLWYVEQEFEVVEGVEVGQGVLL